MNEGASGSQNIDRLVSSEKLNEAIQVAGPSAWLPLCALFVVLATALAWGFTGTLPQTVTAKSIGNADGAGVTCYIPVDDDPLEMLGCRVVVTLPDNSRADGVVQAASPYPLSRAEIAAQTDSDWVLEELVYAEYSYRVDVLLDESHPLVRNEVVPLAIVIAEIPPIELLFGRQDKAV